jgi:CIC family chloride channel protein
MRLIMLCIVVSVLASLFVASFEYILINYSQYIEVNYPIVVTGVASILGGYMLLRVIGARHAMGAGVENIVYEYHIPFRKARLRDLIGKFLATIITVGGGGSGGVQGPSVYFGGYIGGLFSDNLKLSFIERKALMLSGIASALSTFFQTPLGAFFYALEIPYKRDLETRYVVPVLLASITGYILSVLFFGKIYLLPKISFVETTIVLNPLNILLYISLSLMVASFIYLFVLIDRLFLKAKRILNKYLRTELLIALVYSSIFGLTIYFVPDAAGIGYEGFIHIYSTQLFIYAPFLILILIIAKMIATSLTIRSGASAGYFGPSLFIGGLIGLFFYSTIARYLSDLPPLIYVYTGIAAFYGAASTAPIGISILVTELSGNYVLVFPTLLSAFIARELIGNWTLYRTQRNVRLKRSIEELIIIAYRAERYSGKNILEKKIIEVPYVKAQYLRIGDSIDKALHYYINTLSSHIPVINENNEPLGIIDIDKLTKKGGSENRISWELIIKVPMINLNESLRRTIWLYSRYNVEALIIVDENNKYIGVLSVNNVKKYLITEIWNLLKH